MKTNRSLQNRKGFLILGICLVLFMLVFVTGLLSMSEVSIWRIKGVKNRIVAGSLADTGIEYYRSLGPGAADARSLRTLFHGYTLEWVTSSESSFYRYTSPQLQREGYFTLDFHIRNDKVVRAVSTGMCGGMVSKDFQY